MDRKTVAVIWIVGLVLAAGLYLTGPDRFIDVFLNAMASVQDGFQALVLAFGRRTYDLVRALAIGVFVVFVVLGLMAIRQGRRGRWALLVVSVLFLLLVGWPGEWEGGASGGHWLAALLLAAVGALVMTRRLVGPAPAPAMRAPWPGPHRPG